MTTKGEILKSIRANCLECSGGSPNEVQLCTVTLCALHHLRFGRDPNPARGAPKNAFPKKTPTGSVSSEADALGYSGTQKSGTAESTPPVAVQNGKDF